MKGMTLDVYRSASHGDCTNNGISSRFNSLTLVGILNIYGYRDVEFKPMAADSQVFEARDDRPAVVLVREYKQDCSTYWNQYLVPFTTENPRGQGLMFGGNFAASCDSRISDLTKTDALRIHDRRE